MLLVLADCLLFLRPDFLLDVGDFVVSLQLSQDAAKTSLTCGQQSYALCALVKVFHILRLSQAYQE